MTLIPLQLAEIEWTNEGYPINLKFQDKYFTADGLEESNYVFIKGCNLEQRWLSWNKKNYTILETGFGCGLNFLLVMQLWKKQLKNNSIGFKKLSFLSVENSPIPLNSLKKIFALWPELKDCSDDLLKRMPEPIPGRHLIKFKCNGYELELFLLYENIDKVLPQLIEEGLTPIDSFFLDGFSPKKNPDMWDKNITTQLAQLASHESTLSTYTAATTVRYNLEKSGFKITKCKGFGTKREMLKADYYSLKHETITSAANKNVLVIGAGLAGSVTAAKLAERGYFVDIVESGEKICTGASGNAAGIAYPKLGNTYSESCLLQLCGDNFLHSELENLNHVNANLNGMEFIYGESNINSRVSNKTLQRLNLQNSYIRNILPELPNQPPNKLEYVKAGWIEPASLANAYISQHIREKTIRTIFNCKIKKLEQLNNEWIAKGDSRLSSLGYAMVFICNGSEISELIPEYGEFTVPVRGQIDCFKVTQTHRNIDRPICSNGYIIPYKKDKDGTTIYWVGASYQPGNIEHSINENETFEHQRRLASVIELPLSEVLYIESRASNRLSSNDRMPLVGQVVKKEMYCNWYKKILQSSRFREKPPSLDGLYINVGHGSHGLVTIPVMSEYLVRKACREILPINPKIAIAVDPQRYLRRKIRKCGNS